MEISYGLAAEQALFRQNVTMSVMKQASEQQQAVASMLEQLTVGASGRGGSVDISA